MDFGGYFGYSALVFHSGRHIYYANDYELHHRYTKYNDDGTTESVVPEQLALRTRYIDSLNSKLFTEDEIAAPLTDYAEFTAKRYFICNYFPMRADHLSMFGNFSSSENVKSYEEKKKAYPYPSWAAMAYFKDREIVEQIGAMCEALVNAKEAMSESYAYQRNAFYSEMANHEYQYNWQGDYDVLSAFGQIEYSDTEYELEDYFGQLHFNDVQRRAYLDARRDYLKDANNNDW